MAYRPSYPKYEAMQRRIYDIQRQYANMNLGAPGSGFMKGGNMSISGTVPYTKSLRAVPRGLRGGVFIGGKLNTPLNIPERVYEIERQYAGTNTGSAASGYMQGGVYVGGATNQEKVENMKSEIYENFKLVKKALKQNKITKREIRELLEEDIRKYSKFVKKHFEGVEEYEKSVRQIKKMYEALLRLADIPISRREALLESKKLKEELKKIAPSKPMKRPTGEMLNLATSALTSGLYRRDRPYDEEFIEAYKKYGLKAPAGERDKRAITKAEKDALKKRVHEDKTYIEDLKDLGAFEGLTKEEKAKLIEYMKKYYIDAYIDKYGFEPDMSKDPEKMIDMISEAIEEVKEKMRKKEDKKEEEEDEGFMTPPDFPDDDEGFMTPPDFPDDDDDGFMTPPDFPDDDEGFMTPPQSPPRPRAPPPPLPTGPLPPRRKADKSQVKRMLAEELRFEPRHIREEVQKMINGEQDEFADLQRGLERQLLDEPFILPSKRERILSPEEQELIGFLGMEDDFKGELEATTRKRKGLTEEQIQDIEGMRKGKKFSKGMTHAKEEDILRGRERVLKTKGKAKSKVPEQFIETHSTGDTFEEQMQTGKKSLKRGKKPRKITKVALKGAEDMPEIEELQGRLKSLIEKTKPPVDRPSTPEEDLLERLRKLRGEEPAAALKPTTEEQIDEIRRQELALRAPKPQIMHTSGIDFDIVDPPTGEGKKKRKKSGWNQYVAKVRKENPKLSFKEAVKLASKTYKNGGCDNKCPAVKSLGGVPVGGKKGRRSAKNVGKGKGKKKVNKDLSKEELKKMLSNL